MPEFVIKSGKTNARPDIPEVEWHRLTRFLPLYVDRAGQATSARTLLRCPVYPDHGQHRHLCRRGLEAFDHLSQLGLGALLDVGSASFWRRTQPPVSHNVATFDRAFQVRMMANELLGVDEHDRILMAPKLLAKFQARSANLSEEAFRVSAVSSQIDWLETSMADAAALTSGVS